MTFDDAVAFVLKWEGEISDDPGDPGGFTRFGISQRAYPNLDIRNLTRADAIGLYKRDYWDRCSCGDLPAPMALMLFDCAVNQGPTQAIRLMQRALKVKEDGVIGPQTIAATQSQSQDAVAELFARRCVLYGVNPLFGRDGLGWLRRAADCFRLALQT